MINMTALQFMSLKSNKQFSLTENMSKEELRELSELLHNGAKELRKQNNPDNRRMIGKMQEASNSFLAYSL